MEAGELIALVVALGGAITGIGSLIVSGLSARSAARRDELAALSATIESLQKENARLLARLDCLEADLAERDQRIKVLEMALRDQTQARADREHRIVELEAEVGTLQAKVAKLENGR